MTQLERFKQDNPDWADLPDEAIEDSFAFQRWRLGEALDDVWRAMKDGLRQIPWIGRLFR